MSIEWRTSDAKLKSLFIAMAFFANGSGARAQHADLNAVKPLMVLLRQDVADLIAAIKADDAARLKQLAQRHARISHEVAKADPPINTDDPAAVALRAAYMTRANAHSNLGMIAINAAQATTTSASDDNRSVLNDVARRGVGFLLPYHHEK